MTSSDRSDASHSIPREATMEEARERSETPRMTPALFPRLSSRRS